MAPGGGNPGKRNRKSYKLLLEVSKQGGLMSTGKSGTGINPVIKLL